MEAYLGTIMPVAFAWAPRGWVTCEGQLLPIMQYQALYTLIGTTYGGDGRTTFGVPDLRGRVPIGATLGGPPPAGQLQLAPGATNGVNSEPVTLAGSVNIALTEANLPPHAHQVGVTGDKLAATSVMHVTAATGTAVPVKGAALGAGGATGSGQAFIYAATATPDVALNDASVTTTIAPFQVQSANAGGGAALQAPVSASATVSTLQPALCLNFIICVEGLFPQRP